MQERFVSTARRSVIVAADVASAAACGDLARAVKPVRGISGFKVGIEAGLDGLARSVDKIRRASHEDVRVIYDHQKAGNDIPEMGSKFAKKVRESGCDAAILFPFAGPETQTRWTLACQEAGLRVIIGGIMTHQKFLANEGGYVANSAPRRIFELACKQGVVDYVVPGTKLAWVNALRRLLEKRLGKGAFDLYAPGFITQGGDITECGLAAGPYFHAIVGSAIYQQPDVQAMRNAAIEVTRQIAE